VVEPVIVVSGLPRAGTSMVMGMLAAAGVKYVSDGLRTADEDNPRGYFEDERVKNLASAENRAWIAGARGKAIKVVSPILKDLPPDNTYKVLFLRRDLREILASQKKMMDRRGEHHDQPDELMLQVFETHLGTIEEMLRSRSEFDVMYLDFQEVIVDPKGQARRISDFLGQTFDLDAMGAAVDEKLYRNRSS
jgi:hypothetical protein